MKKFAQITMICRLFVVCLAFSGCAGSGATVGEIPQATIENGERTGIDSNLALKVERNEASDEPIGKFDFKNYTYPLPIGWQGAQIREVTLENGVFQLSAEHVGASYVGTKFGDVTGDGREEAMVVVKIETGGSANPQIVYIFEWKNNAPEMIWYFRTGDRADGGIKDLRGENGELVLQLYGQDRYLVGQLETLRITGDEEQICCPKFFTRTRYKWDGANFKLQGTRETYSITNKNALPVENLGEIVEKEASEKR